MALDVARVAVLALCIGGCAAGEARPASRAEREAYIARRGTLTTAETTRVGWRGRYAVYRVRLASSTGMAVTGRLFVPASGAPPFAAVLLNDGRELNSHAVDALPADFGDVVALSLDYPEALPYDVRVGTLVRRQDELRSLAREIPSALSLGGTYLARRADVDGERVALVATSFAVPFAVIAASLDSTFRNVALVYGAGDFPGVLAANLTLRPAWLRTPAARIAMSSFAEFEPARFVAAIAPRPLLMVNGVDDPQMPVPAVRALYAAAREPKSLVWLRTGHLMPDDSALIRALVDTTLARLPVLEHRATPPPATSSVALPPVRSRPAPAAARRSAWRSRPPPDRAAAPRLPILRRPARSARPPRGGSGRAAGTTVRSAARAACPSAPAAPPASVWPRRSRTRPCETGAARRRA